MGRKPANTQISGNSLMQPTRQTVVITGAGRGIGRVIAAYFAKNTGHNLFLISRTESYLLETAQLCRDAGCPAVETATLDLTRAEEVESLVIPHDFSRIRALVNNAGSYATDNPERIHPELLRAQFDNNVMGAALITRRLMPLIRQNDQSLIANICSVASRSGIANAVAYTAAKHALLGYTRSVREHLKGTSVAVTALMPGSTWSTSWEGSAADPQTTIDAEDLAILIETLTRISPRSVVEEVVVAPR